MATETTPFFSSNSPTESDLVSGLSATGSSDASGLRGNDMVRRVAQGAHATIDRLAETAEPVVNRVADSVSGAGGSLHQQADHLREVGSEWTESMRDTVRDNPLAAIGVALAVGMLVARLAR